MTTTTNGGHITGIRDEHFDLISVLYHSLEAAATYEIYCQDAKKCGDVELGKFFREIQQQECDRVVRAKELLGGRLTQPVLR